MRDEDVTCTYCGEPYHGWCTWCHRPGVPYIYKGQQFSGLTAYRGGRLCRSCRDHRMDTEGTNILVVDDRPSIPPYVVNSVRDRDVVHIFMPRELRGVDGRDMARRGRRRRVLG